MGVGTGAAGVAAAVPIFFADHKNRYIKKTKMKKRTKTLFSHAMVFVKFTGVIFANRDNCPQGVRINGERLKPPHHWKAYFRTILSNNVLKSLKQTMTHV